MPGASTDKIDKRLCAMAPTAATIKGGAPQIGSQVALPSALAFVGFVS